MSAVRTMSRPRRDHRSDQDHRPRARQPGDHCNAIAPGLIATDILIGLPEAAKEAILQITPMKEIGKVEDVAAAAVYFASDEAS